MLLIFFLSVLACVFAARGPLRYFWTFRPTPGITPEDAQEKGMPRVWSTYFGGVLYPGGRSSYATATCEYLGSPSMCLFGGRENSAKGDNTSDASSTPRGLSSPFTLTKWASGSLAAYPAPCTLEHDPVTTFSLLDPSASGSSQVMESPLVLSLLQCVFVLFSHQPSLQDLLQDVWDFNMTSLLWRFRSVSNTSETFHSMLDSVTVPPFYPASRQRAAAWLIGNDMLVWGGYIEGPSYAHTWLFSDSSGNWTLLADHSSGNTPTGTTDVLYGMSFWSTADQSRLYMWGGYNFMDSVVRPALMCSFNVSNSTWDAMLDYGTELAEVGFPRHPGGRDGGGAAQHGDFAYIYGGNGYTVGGDQFTLEYLSEMWAYHMPNGTWTLLQITVDGAERVLADARYSGDAFPGSRSIMSIAVIPSQDLLFLYGGKNPFEVADPWTMQIPDCGNKLCEYITLCADGFSPNDTANVCSGHGTCEELNGPCVCENSSYVGDWCESWRCADGYDTRGPNACNGHGNCSIPLGVCDSCDDGFYGHNCLPSYQCVDGYFVNDTSSVCSGRGMCHVPGGDCTCNSDYAGATCEFWKCADGYFSNDPLVCTGHGTCSSLNGACDSCDSGYYLPDCQYYRCSDGYFVNDTNVCSGGRGTCNATGQPCVCSSDYTGSACEYWKCADGFYVSDIAKVCHGHGSCSSLNGACDSCAPGWLSPGCQYHRCADGYFVNDTTNLFSGRGTCSGPDGSCDCNFNYSGAACMSWKCVDGIDVDDTTNVFSGRGCCTGPGRVCTCAIPGSKADQFRGDACEIAIDDESSSVAYYVVGGCLGGVVLAVVSVVAIVLCCIVVRKSVGSDAKRLSVVKKEEDLAIQVAAKLKIKQELFEIKYDEVKLVKQIGKGGSDSVIYRARWKGKDVAFKVFRSVFALAAQADFDEFEREVELQSSLRHPNIIVLWGESEGLYSEELRVTSFLSVVQPPRVGIVLELCANGSIDGYIRREEDEGRPVSSSTRLRLLLEVADAMEFLHSRKILHRDLKGDNVLISEAIHSKLIDFGLSRAVKNISKGKLTTRIGTGAYMAPEMVLGQEYSGMVDVFSFGVLMFVVVTGKSSPYGAGKVGVENKVANDPTFRPVLESEDDHPTWFVALMKKCWSAEADDRPQFSAIREEMAEKSEQPATPAAQKTGQPTTPGGKK